MAKGQKRRFEDVKTRKVSAGEIAPLLTAEGLTGPEIVAKTGFTAQTARRYLPDAA